MKLYVCYLYVLTLCRKGTFRLSPKCSLKNGGFYKALEIRAHLPITV